MKQNKVQVSRYVILTAIFLGVLILATLHQRFGGGAQGYPSIDAICPFGALETVFNHAAGGEFLKRTSVSNYILFGGAVILAFIFGRFFCGWLCALGFIQEVFAKIGIKLFGKKFIIPVSIDRYLRLIKYPLLIFIIFMSWRTASLFIRPADPFAAMAHLPAGAEVLNEFLIGFVILVLSLVLSLFYDRFFCKYLCPMGAFLAVVHKIGLYRITRDSSTCTNCRICDKVCPVNIKVSISEKNGSAECINCMQCVTGCPTKKDTLKPVVAGKFIRAGTLALIAIAVFSLIVAGTKVSGLWTTDDSAFSSNSGGSPDPARIRGYMKMNEIAQKYNVDIEQLYQKLGISKEKFPYDVKMKEIVHKSDNNPNPLPEESVSAAIRSLMADNNQISKKLNDNKGAEKGNDPSEIKGTMTLKEISTAYKIDVQKLYSALKISPDKVSQDIPARDIKGILQKEGRTFEVEEIRSAVKSMKK